MSRMITRSNSIYQNFIVGAATKYRRSLLVLLVAVLLIPLVILRINQRVLADTSTPVSISSLGTPVTQNFNTLALTGTSSTTPTGWGFSESGTNANTIYTAGTGSSTTGDTYSFGAAGSSERAFGGLQSGALVPTIGAVFVNNSGGTINSLDITYTGEQWRLGSTGRTDRLDFQYSTNATSLTTGTYIDFDALDFNGPISTGATGALDGNVAANRTLLSSTITGLSIPSGSTFWLRWNSFDAAGADDGLAIDDFSLTANGSTGDAAPSVASTTPANNATNVAAGSNLTITFSEPVNVSGNWVQIACNTSGTRQVGDTVVSGGPLTFAIDPNSDFAPSEQCTVTVFAAQVSDQDSDDPPDNMVSNATFSFTVAGPPADPGSVVISQVYGGGGNSGATIKNDFIEIINHSGAPISLNGWSVQYASAAGSSWQVTPLTGTVAAGQYYLIQEAAGSGGTINLSPDATGTIAMAAAAGKVALVNSTVALTDACPSDSSIIDFVGFGTTASCWEGSGPTPAPSNTTAALRLNNGCADTNDNADDFTTDAPNPRNTSSPISNCAVLSGIGSANPPSVQPGDSSLLTVNVTPGSNPTSSGITVAANLSGIGGSANQSFTGNGNSFSFLATVALGTTAGQKSLPVTITDAQSRTANTSINLTVLQPPPPSDHIVISQIYGGGGNSSATYSNDFVELYNPGSSPFDLTGWSLQYAAFNGSGWGSNKQPLGGVISPGEYYLIKLASGGAVGAPLPPANVEGVINMSASTGKLALVSSFQPLVGPCPLSDPNLVDFVGYGSTASTANFCYEGVAPATAPSGNTSSILRKNGGNTDTNSNGNDFLVGAVNPRRTAPIVELGPNVLTTDPSSNGFNVPHDASITVVFTEPVDVVGAWYNITCADLTTHNDATVVVSNTSKTYVITPNDNFAFGQQCTVTIVKDNVHDQDTDDSGPNTDTLPADYIWSFAVVGAGAPAPYPPSVHLTMGNPSNAVMDTLQFNNYLMEKPTYSLSYNRDKGTPNWVSWHLEPAWFGSLVRVDTFRPDPAVLPTWYRVQATDYSGSGFDRGHMTPNADRDNENRIPINQETYLMSNMVPQAPDNNQGPWAAFENYLRSIVTSPQDNELYIVSGPWGMGGTGSGGGVTNTIANGNVTVPAFTWKVVLVIPKGENDVSRVTAATRTIAILMPNVQGIRNDPWQNYLTTVDHIEDLTGYDFFANVPDAIENSIEAGTDGANPPGTAGQTVITAEDNSANITLDAVTPSGSLVYTIVSPPTHGQLTGSGANKTYAPDPDYNGPDTFTFKVNNGSQDSNTSTINITITEVNDPPTANDDSTATDEDNALTFSATDLTANDSAGPANESLQILTVTTVTNTADTHGSAALNSGMVTYTPDANYHGPASFAYQVCDNGTTSGSPASLCASATVNITVNSVNDDPVATDDSATTDEDNSVTIDVVANDTDVDGDTRTLQSVGTAAHGSVTIVSGQAQYSPALNFNGMDSFTYIVSDGNGGTGSGTVNITVNPVNDAPAANSQSVSTDGNTPVAITLTGNDVETLSSNLTFTVSVGPTHGSLMGSGANRTYTPALNYSGPDSFKFTVTDTGDGAAAPLTSSEATVSITVNDTINPMITAPSNLNLGTGPGATTCSLFISEATLGTASASDNSGSVSIQRNGVPAGNIFPVGTTYITYIATDDAGNSAQAIQTVVVVDNTAPTITLKGNTILLEPPNHSYHTVNVSDLVESASDNCDATVNLSKVVISKVTSDEIENGNGSGNTINDMVIGADCKSVQLRAEREAGGDGRVYTITFRVTDQSGNSATATAKVYVPKSNGQSAMDSGIKYTVNGTCP